MFNRQTLISYHDGYAKVMAKYGLQRGVRGSEARHTTTTQYYRELKKMNDTLEMESKRLQEQEAEAEQIGLSAMEFAELIKGRIVNFTGRLFSSEHNRWFATDNTSLLILRDNDKRLTITANRIPLSQWFSEQYDKLRQSVRQPVQPKKSRGMKL